MPYSSRRQAPQGTIYPISRKRLGIQLYVAISGAIIRRVYLSDQDREVWSCHILLEDKLIKAHSILSTKSLGIHLYVGIGDFRANDPCAQSNQSREVSGHAIFFSKTISLRRTTSYVTHGVVQGQSSFSPETYHARKKLMKEII